MQVQEENPWSQREREREKIVIKAYGDNKQMLEFKAAPNKKKYCSTVKHL